MMIGRGWDNIYGVRSRGVTYFSPDEIKVQRRARMMTRKGRSDGKRGWVVVVVVAAVVVVMLFIIPSMFHIFTFRILLG